MRPQRQKFDFHWGDAPSRLRWCLQHKLGGCPFQVTLECRLNIGYDFYSRLSPAKQFFVPGENALEIVPFEVEAIVKRHRLLYEMDADTLSAYDDMSLNDVDYVIL